MILCFTKGNNIRTRVINRRECERVLFGMKCKAHLRLQAQTVMQVRGTLCAPPPSCPSQDYLDRSLPRRNLIGIPSGLRWNTEGIPHQLRCFG